MEWHGILVMHQWDILLVTAVSVMGTTMAYVRQPQWKALIFSLPIPFTLATLSLNQPVDITHVMGLSMLLIYIHGVRILHKTCHLPIVLAIAIALVADASLSIVLAPILPREETLFWITLTMTALLGCVLLKLTPRRQENNHRSALPVLVKLPIIIGVVSILIVIKYRLQGFIGFFPMVGILAAYESRHSLWTLCRQVPMFMITATPMLAAIHLCQTHMSLGWALGCGWAVMLTVWAPLQWKDIALQHSHYRPQ